MSLPSRSGRGVGSLFIHRRLSGSTLLEVLVTLALMALVMAGVLGALAVVTSAVGDSRAVMEMTDRVRSAQQRLRQDLAGITAPGLPWLRPDAGQGYLEIIEGPIRDTDYTPEVNGNAETRLNLQTRPRDHTKGDADDIIMFTTRSSGEPFVGRFGNTTVESQVAEVVWFASWDPATDISPVDGSVLSGPPSLSLAFGPPNIVPNNLVDPNPTTGRAWPLLKLYRRTFLVMPELGVVGEQDLTLSGTGSLNETVTATRGLAPGQHDISVRRVVRTSTPSTATIQWIANSLGDLTKPQNRSYHAGNLIPPVTAAGTLPPDPTPTPAGANAVAFAMATNRLIPFANLSTGTLDVNSRYGEDLVMTNVLGFDVKIWDPLAPVYVVTGPVGTTDTDEARDRAPKLLKEGATIVPGDPGYERMLEIAMGTVGTLSPRRPDARGAYVDLYYAFFPNNNSAINLSGATLTGALASASNFISQPAYSIFAGPGLFVNRQTATPDTYLPPIAGGNPTTATYDTWSMHYEFAGGLGGVGPDGRGTNGVDDAIGTPPATVIPADGVVDDIGERVTSPPYPVPLRGIQIKLRVYEPDSRTVREVTVVESLQQD